MSTKTSCINARKRSGMVLILVLILAGLMAGLILNLLNLARLQHQARDTALTHERLQAVMTDTALRLIQTLADDEDLQVDHADEAWNQTIEQKTPDGISVWASISDQNARVDINNVYIEGSVNPAQDLLMDVFTYFGDFTPIDRLQALSDWIDPDEEGFRETDWYTAQMLATECPNTWLNALSDLEHIDGFTKEYLTRDREVSLSSARHNLLNSITILPGAHRSPSAVNANTASPTVLRAIAGLGNDTWVDYLLTARVGNALTSLEPFYTTVGEPQRNILKHCLTTRSFFFLITVKAFCNQSVSQLHALVQRDSTTGDVSILRWVY